MLITILIFYYYRLLFFGSWVKLLGNDRDPTKKMKLFNNAFIILVEMKLLLVTCLT